MTLMERMKEANMGPDANLKREGLGTLGRAPGIYTNIYPLYIFI